MPQLLLDLYKKMYLIREAEKEIRQRYNDNEMKTPMHMSMGSEAIAAGVALILKPNDHTYGTYRSHALYLAVTEETDQFFAELYGKVTGVSGGKAGSMHLASPQHGLIATSAVVGTTIPLALGDAFAGKYRGEDRITAVFFGDGATDEGVFWESLNAACLWRLPVLFVCEDNGLAIHTSTAQRRGYDSLPKIVKNFRLNLFEDTGADAERVYILAREAIDSIRKNNQPALLYLTYYRYLEHVGINEDFDAGYRSKEELIQWQKEDPVNTMRAKLLRMDCADRVSRLEETIRQQVLASRIKAERAPFPEKEELARGVFYGE